MKHNFLKSLRLCAFVALVLCSVGMAWGQSDYSTDYTGNITLSTSGGTNATACKVIINSTQYDGIKAGTGNAAGTVKITIPANTKYIHLHAAGWKGETVKWSIKRGNSQILSNYALTANDGITSNSPFTFSGDPSSTDYYKVITLQNVFSYDTEYTITASSGKRFVIWGVTAESLPDPELSYVPTTVTINEGETLPPISLSNPHSVTGLTFTSSNENLVTVSNTGEINLQPNTHGNARITATFSGNNTYKAQTTTCDITVLAPQHTAKFFVNGAELTSAEVQVREDEAITFPTAPDVIGDKHFMGWTIAEIEGEQSTAPATLVNAAIMGTADVNYYAVYATLESGIIGAYTLDYGAETALSSSTRWGSYGTSYTYTASDGGTWVIKAYKNQGMQINTGKSCSIKVPECPDKITTIEITGSTPKAVGFSVNDYSGSGTITYLTSGKDNSNQTLTLTSNNVTTGYIVPKSGSISITKIVVNYGSNTYSAYCTTIPNTASFTLSQNCYDVVNNANIYYGTYSNTSAFVVPSDLTVAEVSVTSGQLAVTPYDTGAIVPANTGVMVSSETYGLKTIVLSSETGSAKTNSNMLRPTGSGIDNENTVMSGPDANTTYKFYYLTMNGDQIGFYRRNETGAAFAMNVPNKAYLAVPENQTGNVKGFSFNEVVDGIQAVETEKAKNDVIYNLAGQRVSKMQKGLYIVNGKKVLVK